MPRYQGVDRPVEGDSVALQTWTWQPVLQKPASRVGVGEGGGV